MATENKGKPLPKFGEWDVNNPASAEGFTVIFSKASDEKKTKKASGAVPNSQRNQNSDQNNHHDSQNSKAKNPRIMKLNKVNPQEATHLLSMYISYNTSFYLLDEFASDRIRCFFKLFPKMSVTMKMSKTFKYLLGKLRSWAGNLTSFLRADIKWSKEFGGGPSIGHPELSLEKMTSRAVLMYLSMGNMKDANFMMDEVKRQAETINPELSESELIQFISYILGTVKFKSCLEREPLLNKGVQRRNPMQGMFGDIFKMRVKEGDRRVKNT
ncbi:hypothetical protein IGI04_008593, partial [Brassica rapa subsp. trilocularis]